MLKFWIAAAAVATLVGCASNSPQPLMTHGDPAVEALHDSAQRVARAAEQAALAESVKKSDNRVTQQYGIDLTKLPAELREPLLLEGGFHGELEPFIVSLTGAMGWERPTVYGTRAAAPLMVTMTEQRRPAVHWIADAGYQVGDQAQIVINSDLRQVVITYAMP